MDTSGDSVIVTSVGAITPWGLGLEALLDGLASEEELPSPAKCPKVDLGQYLPSEKTYLDRCSELALVAAALALREGGLLDENRLLRLPLSRREKGSGGEAAAGETPALADRIGLGLGTAYGCLDSMYANTQRVQTKGARLASPLLFMHSFVNAPASLIAIEWGIRAPGATFTDGGLSAASALYWACDLLRRGTVDAMLVGGVEALSEPLVRSMVGGRWPVEGSGGDRGLAACPIEAAAVFLLERAEFAHTRGASVLAELAAVSPPTALTKERQAEQRRAEHEVARLQEIEQAQQGVAALEGSVTASPSLAGQGWRAQRAPGESPYYAFGAQFALRVAVALGELRNQPAGAEVLVEEREGFRKAKALLRKP